MRWSRVYAVCGYAVAALLCSVPACLADSAAVAKFYAGKQITLVIGTGAGGGYDAYARLVAQYMRPHIPGTPPIIVQNMPGAAGVTAAGYMYNVAPKDGSFLGTNPPDYLLTELWNPEQVRFDSRKFGWIGTVATVTDVLAVFRSSGVRTIEEARSKELTVGASAAIATNSLQPAIANALLGTRFRLVKGYTGGSDPLTLAMERGEIDGRANSWASWKLLRPQWIADDKLSFLLQFGPKDPEIPGAPPSMSDLVSTPRDKAFVSALEITQRTGRAFFTAPGVPAERLAALRAAFDETMVDPAFVGRMKELAFDLQPQQGIAVQAGIEAVLKERDRVIPELKGLLDLN